MWIFFGSGFHDHTDRHNSVPVVLFIWMCLTITCFVFVCVVQFHDYHSHYHSAPFTEAVHVQGSGTVAKNLISAQQAECVRDERHACPANTFVKTEFKESSQSEFGKEMTYDLKQQTLSLQVNSVCCGKLLRSLQWKHKNPDLLPPVGFILDTPTLVKNGNHSSFMGSVWGTVMQTVKFPVLANQPRHRATSLLEQLSQAENPLRSCTPTKTNIKGHSLEITELCNQF